MDFVNKSQPTAINEPASTPHSHRKLVKLHFSDTLILAVTLGFSNKYMTKMPL